MSDQQLDAFVQALQADSALQDRLRGLSDADSVLAIAKEAGFDVSASDLTKRQAREVLELSDEELSSVSGGRTTFPFIMGICFF